MLSIESNLERVGLVATVAGLLLTPGVARADEGGVSFWLPGQYASLAATPQVPGCAKGLCAALGVPSGGAGVSHSPLVETVRASSRKAARQTGSRHEFDIIDPFHSSKIFWWQLWHCPGWFCACQSSSYGGGKIWASAVT